MGNVSDRFQPIRQLTGLLLNLSADAWRFLILCLRPAPALAAENLFLRKQLALYEEREAKPRRATNAMRLVIVWLSHWFDWQSALRMVRPATFTGWHRQGFRLFWRWKSRLGRPPLPKDLQALIRRMTLENPTCKQERIANELLLKPGIQVSPRTVRKYRPDRCVGGPGKRFQSQRWSTVVRNHAKGILACDFCVAVTVNFRILYVFVVIEHTSRRLVHINVTSHPSAQWTMQQFREAIPVDHGYRFLIHDRDTIFSKQVDQSVRKIGLRALKTPVRTPVANAICERVIGTLRRECLDFMMPLNDKYLYVMLKEWVAHYNEDRPHMTLGPDIPQSKVNPLVSRDDREKDQRWRPNSFSVVSRPILGSLHHKYQFEQRAA